MTVVRSTLAVRASAVSTARRTEYPASRMMSRLMAASAFAASAFAASALAVVTLGAARAHAAPIDRPLFAWSGRVDREVYITMRGRDVRTSGMDARLPNRARVSGALPRGRGDVLVRLRDGRGDVDVIEQPNARNGFSTTIRIRDPRGGADNYRLEAYWQGDAWDDDRDRDRRDRDRDDRWEPDDCRWENKGRGGGWGVIFGRGGGRNDCDDRRGRDPRDRDDRGGWGPRGDPNGSGGVLRWSGRVDDVVELRISGRRVDAITRSGQRVEEVNSAVRGSGLPSRTVSVSIDRHQGRGSVQLVQQPAAWNDYTAVVRIHDPQGGASWYEFSVFWN